MAPRLCFSSWLLVCWLVVTMVEGQEVVTTPEGSPNDVTPTDCQIFTLTPPPITRHPVTRAQPITRTPTYTFFFFHKEGPESTLGFLTDLSSPQTATIVFNSGLFIGFKVA